MIETLKYLDTMVTFSEVPEEVTLCINITNCPCRCKGCHSPYLADDIGKELNLEELNCLIESNKGITCVSFMGGDAYPKKVNELAVEVKKKGLKTCWYSGRDYVSRDIDIINFDYIKVGSYMQEFGPLNSKSTNQRFYKVSTEGLINITNLFWKNET